MIGPEQAASHLVEPFKLLLSPPLVSVYGLALRQALQEAREVASLLIARSADFLGTLPVAPASELLGLVRRRMADMSWRTKEQAARGLVRLAQQFNGSPDFEELVFALVCDQVASVRDVAIAALPAIDIPDSRLVERLARSPLARHRTIFVACARAHIAVGRLPPYDQALLQLASDPIVDVRLSVARGLSILSSVLTADTRRQILNLLTDDASGVVREIAESIAQQGSTDV